MMHCAPISIPKFMKCELFLCSVSCIHVVCFSIFASVNFTFARLLYNRASVFNDIFHFSLVVHVST